MKILLVAPPYALMSNYFFPVGIAYISSTLKANGFDVSCCNNALAQNSEEEFLKTMREIKPDVLGIGGMTPSYNYIKRLFQLAKQENPSLVTVVGGGVLSSEPDVLPALDADIGVLGEGELVSLELMEALRADKDISNIDGIIYKKRDNTVVTNRQHSFVSNLDDIPMPDYEGFDFATCYRQLQTYDMVTSRGCPFHCTFCYSPLGRGKYRFHSLEYIMKEVHYLKDTFDIKQIGMMDEVFALQKNRIIDFCEAIEPLNLSWYTQVRVEIVDPDLLKRMKRSGCTTIFYGLESMSPTVLKSMNKKLKPESTAKALKDTYDSGLHIFGNFIFGDPAETQETAWETLDWWLANRKYFVNLGKIDCWPGTKIYHQAVEKGLIPDKIKFIEDGCPITNLTGMPWETFRKTLETVWLLHEVMLWPGQLVSVDSSDPEKVAAVCRCPHCNTLQTLDTLQSYPFNTDRKAQRISCSTCFHFYDIPLLVPIARHTAEVDALFAQAVALCRRGSIRHALDTLYQIFELTKEHPVALFLAILIHLRAKEHEAARELARTTLRHNPTAPYLLEIASMAYRKVAEYKMAFLLLEQANVLRAARALVVTPQTVSTLDPMEALQRELFPINTQQLDCGLFWESTDLLDILFNHPALTAPSEIHWANLSDHADELARFQRIVFFGAGGRFASLLDEIQAVIAREAVAAVADNEPDKRGTHLAGIPVVAPEDLARINPDLVVITSDATDAIFDQLSFLKCKQGLNFEIRALGAQGRQGQP